jgi:hypothetical protein
VHPQPQRNDRSRRLPLRADAERRNRLTVEGYDILEFTYGHVIETPQDVWTILAAKLGFAMPVLLG